MLISAIRRKQCPAFRAIFYRAQSSFLESISDIWLHNCILAYLCHICEGLEELTSQAASGPRAVVWLHLMLVSRGSQTFSCHVPLPHFDRWACTLKISYNKKAEENNENMFTNKRMMILENSIGFQLVFFFAPKIWTTYSNCFSERYTSTIFDQVKYIGVLLNASLKDDDIQRQVKSIYCAANKFRSTFDQCSPTGKTLSYPLRVNICFANCQLWNKYTQTSAKHLRAYNNAYRIMHYMPRIVSVSRLSPHQVNNCVRTFDALLRNNFYLF